MSASTEMYQSHSKDYELHIQTHNNGIPELKDQVHRAAMLDEERRSAEMKAAHLASERQSALLAKEELARLAESQQKSKEQLVSVLRARSTKDTSAVPVCLAATRERNQHRGICGHLCSCAWLL